MQLNKRRERRKKKKKNNLSRQKEKTPFLLPTAPSWSIEETADNWVQDSSPGTLVPLAFRRAGEGAGNRWRAGDVWPELPVDSLDWLASLKMRSTWCWWKLKNPASPACWVSDSRAPKQIVFPFPVDPCEPFGSAWFACGDRAGNGGKFPLGTSLSEPSPSFLAGPPSPSRRETRKHSCQS